MVCFALGEDATGVHLMSVYGVAALGFGFVFEGEYIL
jgi:hypothetical protein